MLQERWLPWKVGLYDLEVVSRRGCYFQTCGLAYNNTSNSRFYYEVSTEKDAILIVCNILSKIMHFVVTTEETSVEGLVLLFRDNM